MTRRIVSKSLYGFTGALTGQCHLAPHCLRASHGIGRAMMRHCDRVMILVCLYCILAEILLLISATLGEPQPTRPYPRIPNEDLSSKRRGDALDIANLSKSFPCCHEGRIKLDGCRPAPWAFAQPSSSEADRTAAASAARRDDSRHVRLVGIS